MDAFPESVDGLPNLSGWESTIEQAIADRHDRYGLGGESRLDFGRIRSAAAIALHMHQPLIPAGGGDLSTARIISNLQFMMESPSVGDNYNAPMFHWCYKRMGEFIPQLIEEGCEPRVMLDYSGTLLHGLRQMGLHDVFDHLRLITAPVSACGRMAWLRMGALGGAFDTRSGLWAPCEGMAAPLRGHFWSGGAWSCAWLLPGRNGPAESS